MPWVICPCCNQWVEVDQVLDRPPSIRALTGDLPAPAFAILTNAPEAFRNGGVLPVRAWMGLTSYKSPASVHRGLRALEKAGFVRSVTYGRRQQYAGTAKMKLVAGL